MGPLDPMQLADDRATCPGHPQNRVPLSWPIQAGTYDGGDGAMFLHLAVLPVHSLGIAAEGVVALGGDVWVDTPRGTCTRCLRGWWDDGIEEALRQGQRPVAGACTSLTDCNMKPLSL